MNLGMSDADFAQLFLDLRALDVSSTSKCIDWPKIVALRTPASRAWLERRGHMIASHVKPARSGWIHVRQFFQLVRLTAHDQFRQVDVAT
jgi:hypothetical protein